MALPESFHTCCRCCSNGCGTAADDSTLSHKSTRSRSGRGREPGNRPLAHSKWGLAHSKVREPEHTLYNTLAGNRQVGSTSRIDANNPRPPN